MSLLQRLGALVIALALGCGGSGAPPPARRVVAPTPAPAASEPAAPEAPPVIQIAAGSHHTCALIRNGTVRCWGRAYERQLGDPRMRVSASAEATLVVGLDDAVEIAVGETFGCARRRRGTVACWGRVFGGARVDAARDDPGDARPLRRAARCGSSPCVRSHE